MIAEPGSAPENAPQEMPGQQTIDEAIVTAGEQNSNPPVTSTEGQDSADSASAAATGPATGESGSPEPDPTAQRSPDDGQGVAQDVDASPADPATGDAPAPDEHRFRIVHEIANAGSELAHSSSTSAPMVLQEAIDYLVKLAAKFLL